MVQIIEGKERRPSFVQQLLGSGLESGMQAYQQRQEQNQLNQAYKQLGIPPGTPPELAKTFLAEQMKQQGKQGLLQQKQDYLEQLFGGQTQKPGMGQQLTQGEEISPSRQEKTQGLSPLRYTEEQITAATLMDPALGRDMRHANDVALREQSAAETRALQREKFEEQKRLTTPEHQREEKVTSAQAQADVKYNQELQASAKQHELKEKTLERLEALNKKGVTGKPYEKLLEKTGLVALTSEGRREFAAEVKNLITDIRSILGAQFTGFEFQTILNAYPSADFSKGANTAIIKNLKEFQDIKSKEVQFANQLKKENGGKIPEDFQTKVNEMVHQYALSRIPEIKENTRKIMNEEYGIPEGNFLMFDPKGEPLNVPEADVERYQALGATLP